MIRLTIQEKERIGKLLKYYRKKNKIQWKEIEKKMSKSTYQKIETGHISKKDEIYKRLFDLHQFPIIIKDNFNEWLEDYLIRFNEVLEEYKEEQFDSLIDELEVELGPYKNRIIYEQYCNAITYILNYYKDTKYMSLEEIEDCLQLFECFDFEETIQTYLLEVMFISNNNKHASYEILKKIFSLLDNTNPILWYLVALNYKVLGQLDSALSYFDKSYEYWRNRENRYRTIRSLIGKFMIYKNIDKVKANVVANELLNLKENNHLNHQLIENLNYTIAMYYYVEKKYEEALPLFVENYHYNKIDREILFICAIHSQLEMEIPESIHEISMTDHPYRIYLNYFKLKELKKSNKELVDYIMNVITPLELIKQKNKLPFWKMFEEELVKISIKEKKYAIKLTEYIDKKNKICGNN